MYVYMYICIDIFPYEFVSTGSAELFLRNSHTQNSGGSKKLKRLTPETQRYLDARLTYFVKLRMKGYPTAKPSKHESNPGVDTLRPMGRGDYL